MTYRAVIVDDEAASMEYLQTMLERYTSLSLVGTASSPDEAVKLIEELRPDVVFMDVNMPPYTGFDVLDRLTYKGFQLVFCTVYDSYAIRAIRYAALDYLLKPVRALEIQELMPRLQAALAEKSTSSPLALEAEVRSSQLKKIALPTANGYLLTKVDDIVFLEAASSYTCITLLDGTLIVVTKTLATFDEILDEEQFLRIHASHTINLQHVHLFIRSENLVEMVNKKKLSVAVRRKEELLKRLNIK